MRFLIALIILCSHVYAADPAPRDHKRGFVLGIGGNISAYMFPVQFNGQTKNKIDDSQTLYGPSLNVGYDFILRNRYLLGLRAEGFIADTLGTGAQESSKETDKTTGKLRQGALSLRAGYLFDFNSFNLVGDHELMTGEFFIEAGLSTGHKSFSKNYSTTDGVTENYHENLEEEYQGRVLAAGINITSKAGAFFEFKIMQSAILKNKQTFRGTKLENGGGTVSTDQKLEDQNRKSFPSILITVGHHY